MVRTADPAENESCQLSGFRFIMTAVDEESPVWPDGKSHRCRTSVLEKAGKPGGGSHALAPGKTLCDSNGALSSTPVATKENLSLQT